MLEPMRYELASFAFWPQFRAGVIIVVASEWENFSSLTFVNFSHSDDVFWQYWAFNIAIADVTQPILGTKSNLPQKIYHILKAYVRG